jgi:hypothetical protein
MPPGARTPTGSPFMVSGLYLARLDCLSLSCRLVTWTAQSSQRPCRKLQHSRLQWRRCLHPSLPAACQSSNSSSSRGVVIWISPPPLNRQQLLRAEQHNRQAESRCKLSN